MFKTTLWGVSHLFGDRRPPSITKPLPPGLATAQTWLDLKEQGANYNQIRDAFYRQNASKLKNFKKELKKEANGKAADAGKYEREMEGMVHFMRWSSFVEPRVSELRGDMSAMNEGMYRAIQQKSREVSSLG